MFESSLSTFPMFFSSESGKNLMIKETPQRNGILLSSLQNRLRLEWFTSEKRNKSELQAYHTSNFFHREKATCRKYKTKWPLTWPPVVIKITFRFSCDSNIAGTQVDLTRGAELPLVISISDWAKGVPECDTSTPHRVILHTAFSGRTPLFWCHKRNGRQKSGHFIFSSNDKN